MNEICGVHIKFLNDWFLCSKRRNHKGFHCATGYLYHNAYRIKFKIIWSKRKRVEGNQNVSSYDIL